MLKNVWKICLYLCNQNISWNWINDLKHSITELSISLLNWFHLIFDDWRLLPVVWTRRGSPPSSPLKSAGTSSRGRPWITYYPSEFNSTPIQSFLTFEWIWPDRRWLQSREDVGEPSRQQRQHSERKKRNWEKTRVWVCALIKKGRGHRDLCSA